MGEKRSREERKGGEREETRRDEKRGGGDKRKKKKKKKKGKRSNTLIGNAIKSHPTINPFTKITAMSASGTRPPSPLYATPFLGRRR